MNILPTSISSRHAALAVACGLGLSTALPAQAAESWREFARRSMMPEYSWNDAPPAQSLAPSVRDTALRTHRHAVTLAFSDARAAVQRSLTLSLEAAPGTGLSTHAVAPVEAADFQTRLSPLSNQFFGAAYAHDAGAKGRFGVSALVAQQQFATPGFGLMPGMREPVAPEWVGSRAAHQGETVMGHGVRVDYRLPVGEQFAWGWSAQSKLEMEAFESLHGIHGEPGEFDLPARLGVQMEWFARSNLAFALGMERVYFSDIVPFTSNALPQRLLSLMGDGNAPGFAWRDLTVYSAEGRLSDRWQGQWLLRYTTRQQPAPTSDLYRRAFQSEYADTNLSLGYHRGLNGWGEMALTASYAPSMAFLGPGPVFASQTYSRGAVAEFEAFWIVPF